MRQDIQPFQERNVCVNQRSKLARENHHILVPRTIEELEHVFAQGALVRQPQRQNKQIFLLENADCLILPGRFDLALDDLSRLIFGLIGKIHFFAPSELRSASTSSGAKKCPSVALAKEGYNMLISARFSAPPHSANKTRPAPW